MSLRRAKHWSQLANMLNLDDIGLAHKKTKLQLLQIHPSGLKAEYLFSKGFYSC